MNIDFAFKFFVFDAYVLIAILAVIWRVRLLAHWKTTLAGLLVIGVTTFIELFYIVHIHRCHDPVTWLQFLVVGIGFLLCADA